MERMKPKRSKLSVVLAASNEERMIEPCLKLLRFADEIVVIIDTRSTDATERIAKRYTKNVYRRKLESFAAQKNYGIAKSTGDWALIVDADERVTPALATEIRTVVASSRGQAAFKINRRNYFFGHRMRFGGWQRDQQIRLIKGKSMRYRGDIHETFSPAAEPDTLKEPLWHFTHRSVESMMLKTVNFGRIQANEMLRSGHPPVTTASFFKVPAKELYFRLIKHRGYRDGPAGVIESIYQAFSLFVVYVILWQKQQKPSLDETYAKLEQKAKAHK